MEDSILIVLFGLAILFIPIIFKKNNEKNYIKKNKKN